jgi:hypothetical protein
MTTETRKLVVQSNGWIVLETRGDRFVQTSPARDLVYRLQYKSTKGWWEVTGEFHDEMTARQALREANPRIQWRLVASNEHGIVALPKGWRGRC